jgi:predicted lipoprotein with Yx(FWY)xxD motif
MRKALNVLIPFLAAATLLSACGSSSTSSTTTAAPAAGAESSASSATVKTASNSTVGKAILVNAQGMTLYRLTGESAAKFICTSAACLKVWHPVTAGAATSGSGVRSLGTVTRPDGTMQATYKGEPLYTFAEDTKPGQASGQGIKDVGTWEVVPTGGGASTASAPAAAAGTSTESESSSSVSSGGGGGGYAY